MCLDRASQRCQCAGLSCKSNAPGGKLRLLLISLLLILSLAQSLFEELSTQPCSVSGLSHAAIPPSALKGGMGDADAAADAAMQASSAYMVRRGQGRWEQQGHMHATQALMPAVEHGHNVEGHSWCMGC